MSWQLGRLKSSSRITLLIALGAVFKLRFTKNQVNYGCNWGRVRFRCSAAVCRHGIERSGPRLMEFRMEMVFKEGISAVRRSQLTG